MTPTSPSARLVARRGFAMLAIALMLGCGGGSDKNPTEPVQPAQLGLAVAPSSSARSGAVLVAQPLIRLLDASGNRVAKAGVAVTVSIASGGGALHGTTTVVTDAGGAAAFTDLAISGIVGARTLAFTAPGLTGVSSGTITLGVGDPAQLVFLNQPGTTASGAIITPAIQVALRDDAGNQTAATSAVTMGFGSNTSSGGIRGTLTVNAVAGVATFSDIIIEGSGSDYVLVASSANLPQAASNVFGIDAAPAVVSTSPANGASAVALDAAVSVTFSEPVTAAADAFQLACPTGTSVPFTLSASPATAYTLTPQAAFPQGTTCTLTVVAASVHDADAVDGPDAMTSNYVVSFATMAFHAADDDWSADASKRVIGNTSLVSGNGSPAFGVTDNDDIAADAAVIWTGWNGVAGRTEQGGEVSMTATGAQRGRFTYDARAGFEGTDRFSYIVAKGGAVDTATVTLTVGGMIWFVDLGAASCTSVAAGCGRLSQPYSSLESFQAENDGAGDHPAAGDAIFLAQGANPYTGGVTLLAGQKLIGQDATESLAVITGLTPAAGATTLPVMSPGDGLGARIAAPVVLAANNTLRGVEISTSSGIALYGGAIGTLHVAPDVSVISADRALNLTGTAIDGSFGRVHTTGAGGQDAAVALAVQGTTGVVTLGGAADTIAGVSIAYGNGTWVVPGTLRRGPDDRAVTLALGFAGNAAFSGNIVKTGQTVVSIQGIGAATVTFSGASKDLSQVLLDGNNRAASIAFTNGGLHVDGGTTLIALRARSGGTLSITGPDNLVATNNTNNPAVYISGSFIGGDGVTLRSVTSNTGSTAGLWLENVSGTGRFEVTGSGASSRSSSTRGRVTTRATNDSTGTGALTLGSGGTLTGGSPVLLRSAGTVVLRNIVSQSASTNGVDATGTTQLLLDNALVTGARQYGLYVADRASAVVTHSEFTAGSVGGDAAVAFLDPAPSDTVEHTIIQSTASYGVAARLQARDANVRLRNLSISQATWCALFVGGSGTGTALTTTFSLAGSDFACQRGVVVGLAKQVATGTVDISANTFQSTASSGIDLDYVADSVPTAVLNVRSNSFLPTVVRTVQALSLAGTGSTVRLTLSGNNIGNSSVASSGGTSALIAAGKQNYVVMLDNNRFQQTSSTNTWFNLATGGTLQLTTRSNIITVNPAIAGLAAFRIDLPSSGAHCIGLVNNDYIQGTANGVRFTTAAGTATASVVGYTGATSSASALQTYFGSASVSTVNSPAAFVSLGAGSAVSGTAAVCQMP